jgi:hypothetical protein
LREVQLHCRLAEALGLFLGIGHEDVPLHPDRGAAREFSLGLRRAAALRQRFLEGIDIGLGKLRRSEGDEMHAVLAGPGRAGRVGGAVPERGIRFLQRPQRDWHAVVFVVGPGITERVGGQADAEAFEGVDEDLARILVLDLVVLELERRHAAADAHHATPLNMVPVPGVYLGAVARATKRMRFGPLVYLLPLARSSDDRRLTFVKAADEAGIYCLHVAELRRFDVIEQSDFHEVLKGGACGKDGDTESF